MTASFVHWWPAQAAALNARLAQARRRRPRSTCTVLAAARDGSPEGEP